MARDQHSTADDRVRDRSRPHRQSSSNSSYSNTHPRRPGWRAPERLVAAPAIPDNDTGGSLDVDRYSENQYCPTDISSVGPTDTQNEIDTARAAIMTTMATASSLSHLPRSWYDESALRLAVDISLAAYMVPTIHPPSSLVVSDTGDGMPGMDDALHQMHPTGLINPSLPQTKRRWSTESNQGSVADSDQTTRVEMTQSEEEQADLIDHTLLQDTIREYMGSPGPWNHMGRGGGGYPFDASSGQGDVTGRPI